MALHYFPLCDGHARLSDAEGRQIAASLVPPAALKEARSIISQDALGGSIKLGQWIEVLDENGDTVHRLPFRDAVTVRE